MMYSNLEYTYFVGVFWTNCMPLRQWRDGIVTVHS